MGQQQLLLIVLGVIVVGLTILVGMSIAATSSEEANRDAVTSDLIRITSLARSHYLRPAYLAGGGNSFKNFKIPESMKNTGHGTFKQVNEGHGTDHIHFEGTGTAIGENGVDPVRIEFRITMDEIRITQHN
jgi:hypothetical protein